MQAWQSRARKRARFRRLATVLAVAWWLQVPVAAQYIAPGQSNSPTGIPAEELLDERVNSARWNLGGLRLNPWLGVRDASLVNLDDGRGGSEEDFTATVGAGLRGYVRGGKVVFAAHALPEYTWWQDNDAKRGLNGRYGLGLFGYFNRLTFEASARRTEQQSFFTSEVQELTTVARTRLRLAVEVDVWRSLTIFAEGSLDEPEGDDEDLSIFSLLDRKEESVLAGLRLEAASGWALSIAHQERETEFDTGARALSNSGSSEQVALAHDGGRLDLRFGVAFNSLTAEAGSFFRDFDETTGDLELSVAASDRTAFFAYGRRTLIYAISFDNAYFLSDRFGARLDIGIGDANLGVFAETGEDDFEPIDPAATFRRVDDVTAFGASLGFTFGRQIGAVLDVVTTDYSSNSAAFDREITSVGFRIELNQLFQRLRLGEPGGTW